MFNLLNLSFVGKIFEAIFDINKDDTFVNENIIRKIIIIFSRNDLLLIL